MKYETVQAKMTAIHKWAFDQHVKVNALKATATSPEHKAMLGGKAKAYLDCACFMTDRFGKYIVSPTE